MPETIRVAISGGGLAGASLAHALLTYPHLDVHIFESAPEFKEAGAAVGIARNALAALDLIGPSAAAALERAGAVPLRGVRFMLAQGDSPNSLIDEADGSVEGQRVTSIVHRAAFLHQLLNLVPNERMHASKKLEHIETAKDGTTTVRFTDGSTHECDILIGADGIRSSVRRHIIGENDPAALPRNAGWWAIMALRPYELARTSIGNGPVNIEDAREYMWIGDNTYLMHNVLNQGELVQLVLSVRDPEAKGSDRWHSMVSADKIRDSYKEWPEYLKTTIDELLCDQLEQPAIYLWEHPPAASYVSGPVCIVGDAAHATTPWQSSGAGMAIEDSLILSTLLGLSKTPTEAVVSLRVYDEVRRPRTQRIVESSRGTGDIMTGRGPETGLNLAKLREKLLPRWEFIVDFDIEAHVKEAKEMLMKELANEQR